MIRPPTLQAPPAQYDQHYLEGLLAELRQYFQRANLPYPANLATVNINYSQLPTDASLASLNSGDVYRDTTAGNALKVKP